LCLAVVDGEQSNPARREKVDARRVADIVIAVGDARQRFMTGIAVPDGFHGAGAASAGRAVEQHATGSHALATTELALPIESLAVLAQGEEPGESGNARRSKIGAGRAGERAHHHGAQLDGTC
jgi:hypothetical protein